MTSNNLLFFRYIANNKMSTQQEIENPSTSHKIGQFIEKKFWISAERKEITEILFRPSNFYFKRHTKKKKYWKS